jgi:hypothetical protein
LPFQDRDLKRFTLLFDIFTDNWDALHKSPGVLTPMRLGADFIRAQIMVENG